MRALLAILRLGLRSLRGAPSDRGRGALAGARRLALVVTLASLAGATAGVVPAVVGLALGAVAGTPSQPASPPAGLAGALARLLAGAPPLAAGAAALAATLLAVGAGVLASRKGSELAGDLTAALRVEMLRAVLHASPRDVEAAGRAAQGAHAARGPAPPGKAGADVRGAEVVKLAIARDAGLVADFAVAFLTGLPQAAVTLAVLAIELAQSGMAAVLAGVGALFLASRLVADRASRRVAREMRSLQHADTAVFGALGESVAASEDLRLLGARGQATRDFADAALRVADARRRFGQALAVSGQIKGIFVALAPLVLVAALGLARGAAGAGEVGKLLLVVPLLMARLEALDALRAGFIERAPVLGAALALLQLPERPPPVAADDAAEPSGDARAPCAISFRGVSYTPPGAERPVLDDLSLDIPAGAVVGLCGRSGCGKSTLLRLLLRLDEPSSGTILVGGADLRRIPPARLPAIFAVLGQGARLLERSVADNLALGLDPPPSEDRMREALRRVELDAFAAGAGDRGLRAEVRLAPPSLSGGEARRLLLARMLLRAPRVFVLDEPEAGLPSATAEALLRAVDDIAAGRTALVATHAPHLLRSTFNVLLHDGRVAATGTHDELAATSAPYRALLAEALRRQPAPEAPPAALR